MNGKPELCNWMMKRADKTKLKLEKLNCEPAVALKEEKKLCTVFRKIFAKENTSTSDWVYSYKKTVEEAMFI